jgi:hypothetical protein
MDFFEEEAASVTGSQASTGSNGKFDCKRHVPN